MVKLTIEKARKILGQSTDKITDQELERDIVIAEAPDYKKRDVYICGPKMLMKEMKNALIEKGLLSSQIHTEDFSLD